MARAEITGVEPTLSWQEFVGGVGKPDDVARAIVDDVNVRVLKSQGRVLRPTFGDQWVSVAEDRIQNGWVALWEGRLLFREVATSIWIVESETTRRLVCYTYRRSLNACRDFKKRSKLLAEMALRGLFEQADSVDLSRLSELRDEADRICRKVMSDERVKSSEYPCEKVVQGWREGLKPSEIAEMHGIEVSLVYRAGRLIRAVART